MSDLTSVLIVFFFDYCAFFFQFSARMNAWATWWAGTWLMGECEINDIVADDGRPGRDQGLLVKRCRFLEESGCASVCVNSCKIPTQNFFLQDMGLPLTVSSCCVLVAVILAMAKYMLIEQSTFCRRNWFLSPIYSLNTIPFAL